MLHRVKELRGDSLLAKDGDAGSLDDVVFENRRWDVRFVVVKMRGRRVLVSPAALHPDFLIDDQAWAIADMVVDTRSWFPGGRRVLVPPSAVERIDEAARKVRVRLSRDEVRNAPEARVL
jgi:hypothetical protein